MDKGEGEPDDVEGALPEFSGACQLPSRNQESSYAHDHHPNIIILT